ncbi:MAG: HDOD domain-containing protein [Sideroxydans sp.]|nr:HDOD domain-containing protein [Sideroxydans sp.]
MNAPNGLLIAVQQFDILPTLPLIAQKLLALDLESDTGEQQLMQLISQDPLISAKIIGLANSPLFGSSRQINSVKEAAVLLGLTRIKSLVTSIAITSLANTPIGKFDPHELWSHTMSVAFAMLPVVRAMPAKQRPTEDQIFLAGMLHDIGYLALAHLDSKRSDALHTLLLIEKNRALIEIEQKLLDVTHAELGAALASHWSLPADMIDVIRYHHSPAKDAAAPLPVLALVIQLTERLMPTPGLNEYHGETVSADEWLALGIDPNQADEITALIAEQTEQAIQFVASF